MKQQNSFPRVIGFSYLIFNLLNLAATIAETKFPEIFPNFSGAPLGSNLISRNPDDIQFYLYPNKLTPNQSQEIVFRDRQSLKKANFIPGKNVIIFVHGFFVNITNGGCKELKNAYLKQNYVNIICIDWGKLSGHNLATISGSNPLGLVSYPMVLKNTIRVGRRLADFLYFLVDNKVVADFDTFHLVGYSLGAHIIGTAGGFVSEEKGVKVGRITGLAPAGPFYQVIPIMYKFDKSHAAYVDAIHTDTEYYGTSTPLGNADYYVNGGRGKDQPGCKNLRNKEFFADVACGHVMAIYYYQRAILGEKLSGCRCKNNPKARLTPSCPKPQKCEKDQAFGPNITKGNGTFFVEIPLNPPANIVAVRSTATCCCE